MMKAPYYDIGMPQKLLGHRVASKDILYTMLQPL